MPAKATAGPLPTGSRQQDGAPAASANCRHGGRAAPAAAAGAAVGLNQARVADDDTVSITLTQLQHRGYDE